MPYAQIIAKGVPHKTNGDAVRNALRVALRHTRTLYTFQEFQVSWPSTSNMLERLIALVGVEIPSPFNPTLPYIEHALIDLHTTANRVMEFDCRRVEPSPLLVDAALMLSFCTRLIRLAAPVASAKIAIKNGDDRGHRWDWASSDFTEFRAARAGQIEVTWDKVTIKALLAARSAPSEALTAPTQPEANGSTNGTKTKRVRYHGRGKNTPLETVPANYTEWLQLRFKGTPSSAIISALVERLLSATDIAILNDIVRDYPRAPIPRNCL